MKRYILALGIIICGFVSADAASLFGKVIEVSSGDVITIYNLNRPVRVKLMGIAAPEMNQAFGDVAKKHLADLVFEKSVVVEYAGIAADSSLTGRVLLNDADVGAQMIRDGAAWFDLRSGDRLSATNKEVYEQSEQAARTEKRGLWQQPNPVAPWEFARAEKIRRNTATSQKAIVPDSKPRRSGPAPELNNLSLIAGRNGGSEAYTREPYSAYARSAARKNWSRFQPEGEDFSVEMPEGGEHATTPSPIGAQVVDVKSYMIRDGWAVYSAGWFKAPTLGETNDVVFEAMSKDLLAVAIDYNNRDNRTTDYKCQPPEVKKFSQNGYAGAEFDLSSCGGLWRMRIYTKVVNNERVMYAIATAYAEEDSANVMRFMKTFTVGTPAKTRSR